MIYILIFLILACTAFLDIVITPKIIRIVLSIIILVVLVTLAGIRWDVGPDWESYHTFFVNYEQYRDGVYINLLEPGYTWLNGLVKGLGGDYTQFLFFIAILTIGLKYAVFLRHSKMVLIVIFLYYCYYLADIASVRQFTALSITLLSSVFIISKRPVLFTVCIILAMSIHISSVAFLGAYWIYHKKISNKALAILLTTAFILGFLNVSGVLLEKAINLLGPASIYAEKLLRYNESGVDSSSDNPYIGFLLGALKRAIIIPFLFYFSNRVDDKDKDIYRGYLNLLVTGNILYFLFIISFPPITRIAVSFLYFEIFLLAFALVSVKDQKLKFVIFIFLVMFGGFRLYSFMAPYIDLYLPYKTFIG
jgi:hypothetical protein